MKFVIRRARGPGNLYLTAGHRWGRLDKAQQFTQRQVDVAEAKLTTRCYGILSLAHARSC
ncbi:MAG: hypothetical protein NT031_12850 [Planctomycetota bacterium]|nr:hypothetical protein [Planctomycetota bacterium]